MSGTFRRINVEPIVGTMAAGFGTLDIPLPPSWDAYPTENVFLRFSVQTDNPVATLPDILVTGEFISGSPSSARFFRGAVGVDVIVRGEVCRT